MRNKQLYIEAFLGTLLVFVLMGMFAYIPFNIKIFNPLKEEMKDFKFTDLYYSKFRSEKGNFEDKVVLVNIGYEDRAGIARIINSTAAQDPAVIALDVVFADLRTDEADTLLQDALANAESLLVTSSHLTTQGDTVGVINNHGFFGTYQSGFANFVGEKPHSSTIRYFRPVITMNEKDHFSFASEIARKYKTEKANSLLSRHKSTERINYIGNLSHFPHFDHFEVIPANPDLEIMKDKIVILGFMGSSLGVQTMEDIYFSPLNEELAGRSLPDIYGVVIHANIVSMILNEDYVNKMSTWLATLIAFIICYIHVIFFMYFFVHQHIWYHLFAKIAQLVTSVLLLYIVFQFFSREHYEINSTITVAAILLSVDVLYLYESLAAFLYKKKGIKSYFIHEH